MFIVQQLIQHIADSDTCFNSIYTNELIVSPLVFFVKIFMKSKKCIVR